MSATDITDWPGHPDADPDCEFCLGDGLQDDGETPCPCIDARKGYRVAQASPDQYRREGFQAGIEAAKEACRNTIKDYDVMEPGKPDRYASMKTQRAAKGMVRLAIQEISAIDVDEVLARLPPAPDAVARLVEAVKNERHHKSAYDATPADRGGHKGPKGQAYVLWCEARAEVGTALAAMEASDDRT